MNTKSVENIEFSTKDNFIRILKGTGICLISTLIFLLIFSVLLTYTNIPESSIPTVIIIITAISILIGSYLSTINIRKQGILNGGIIGLIYILFIYIISSIANGNFSLNISSIIMIVSSILAGMLRRNYWCKYEIKLANETVLISKFKNQDCLICH